MLRLLLRAGAERDAPTTDRGQWTPLHIACRYTSVECVHLLLRWGASLGPTARPVSEGDTFCLGRRSGRSIFDYGGGARKNIASLSDVPEEDDHDDDEENGYGKTPAEVIGLKNLAAAATDPAGNGGSGPSADPSLDEEEEQMVVLGDDDGEKSPAERTQAPIHLFCTFVRHGTEMCTSSVQSSALSLSLSLSRRSAVVAWLPNLSLDTARQ